MRHQGPLLTLLAGGVLAVGIGGLSARAASQDSAQRGEKGTSTAAAPSAIAPSAVAPAPAPAAGTGRGQGQGQTQGQGQGQGAAAGQAGARPAPLDQIKRDYAGYTRGGAATLAIAVRADKAIAYLCDGRVVESWLRGSVSGGRFDLSGKHDAHLTGRITNGKITGSAVVRGHTFDFTVVGVKRPSGLYRLTAEVRGARMDGGWIVLPDGRQVGIMDTNDVPALAPRLDTASKSADVNGQRVPAQEVTP